MTSSTSPPCGAYVIRPGLADGLPCQRPAGHPGLHGPIRPGEVTREVAPADGPNAGAERITVGTSAELTRCEFRGVEGDRCTEAQETHADLHQWIPADLERWGAVSVARGAAHGRAPETVRVAPRAQDAVGTDQAVAEDWRERARQAEGAHIAFMRRIAWACAPWTDGDEPLPSEDRLVDMVDKLRQVAGTGLGLRERLRRVLTDADDADEFGAPIAATPPDLGTCTSASPEHDGHRLEPHPFQDACTDWIPIAVGRHAEPGPTAREYVGRPRNVSCVPGCILTQGHWNCVTVHSTPDGPPVVLPRGGAEVVVFGNDPEA